ncbi:hypothetical protein BH10PSE7_BH10PSE7_14640 [soil metagenome]
MRPAMRLAACFLAVLLAGAAAAEEPAKTYLPRKETYKVLVLGDSLAAGLWSGMMRMAADDASLSIDGRYKEDSGLARPEYYDWPESIPKILENSPIDIAVVLVGANDRQVIKNGEFRYAFGTREWTKLYETYDDRLIEALKHQGVAIYWVGLPPMQERDYDDAAVAIMELQRERAKAAGIRFVETRATLAPDGVYTNQGPDETGTKTRLRSNDGVHFLRPGNNRLANLVLDAIRADIKAAAATDVPGLAGKEDQEPGQGPAFGTESNVIHLDPGDVGNTIVMNQPGGAEGIKAPSGAPITDPTEAVKPGTAAARLFTLGEPVPSKPGRFDDFAMPQ